MAAALAIIGTLLGTLLGAVLAYLRDRAHWARSDATRWHDAKFATYAAFLTAAREAERSAVVVALYTVQAVRTGPAYEPRDFDREGWETWQRSHEELRRQRGTLELVGSAPVMAAALAVELALEDVVKATIERLESVPRVPGDDLTMGQLFEMGIDPPDIPDPDPQAARAADEAATRLADGFAQFVTVARKDLGAPTRSVWPRS